MSNRKKPKPWPTLPSDESAIRFVEDADLSMYDWNQTVSVVIKFRRKNSLFNRFVRMVTAKAMQVIRPKKS